MKHTNIQKLTIAGILCAVAVVGSMFSFPVLGSKCAPVQHMVNILCAVLLGLGSLMAFPGSMFGALLCGLAYWKLKAILPTLVAEVFGTSILGGLCAWPVAVFLMGQSAGEIAFYVYIVPFLVSTAGGAVLSGILLYALARTGALAQVQRRLDLPAKGGSHAAGNA